MSYSCLTAKCFGIVNTGTCTGRISRAEIMEIMYFHHKILRKLNESQRQDSLHIWNRQHNIIQSVTSYLTPLEFSPSPSYFLIPFFYIDRDHSPSCSPLTWDIPSPDGIPGTCKPRQPVAGCFCASAIAWCWFRSWRPPAESCPSSISWSSSPPVDIQDFSCKFQIIHTWIIHFHFFLKTYFWMKYSITPQHALQILSIFNRDDTNAS